ncbi:MAG: GspE/PulE family protein [Planctomycetota bacterium]
MSERPGWFAGRIPASVLAGRPDEVPAAVDAILEIARDVGASDVHLRPTSDGTDVRIRIDGVLHEAARLPAPVATNVVARLKVLAGLLTYRVDVPQEGRIATPTGADETRVSVFPTLFGEKVVVRLFASSGRFDRLDGLGLPADVDAVLRAKLGETGGVILISGPAGSGKTTTAYAALREIAAASQGSRSLVSLEDPIECVVPGVDQTSVDGPSGIGLAEALRAVVRQDPDVLLIGEIRDRETAEAVFRASLIGHLVLTTFHAGSCGRAVGRLCDMGIEPYLIRGGLAAAFCQRLLRKLCECKTAGTVLPRLHAVGIETHFEPGGCDRCRGTGYDGRVVVSEMLDPDEAGVGDAILGRRDVKTLERVSAAASGGGLADRCLELVGAGVTSFAEVLRLLGSEGLRDVDRGATREPAR